MSLNKYLEESKMRFHVIFHGKQRNAFTYSLDFVPSPMRSKGQEELVDICQRNPNYNEQDLQLLFENEKIERNPEYAENLATILIDNDGIGTENDLNNLTSDLMKYGYKVKIMNIN
jgi:hypothetical protein